MKPLTSCKQLLPIWNINNKYWTISDYTDDNGTIIGRTIEKILKSSDTQENVPIANILWNEDYEDCYIQTIGDRFQTYVASFETFSVFIYLVDTIFDEMRLAQGQEVIY